MKWITFLWNTPSHVSSLLPSFQYLLPQNWPKDNEPVAPSAFTVYYMKDIIMLLTALSSSKMPPFENTT